jgi:hypothetical protein
MAIPLNFFEGTPIANYTPLIILDTEETFAHNGERSILKNERGARVIGMELVTEIVKTVVLTGKLANPDLAPVSLLLISPPEHGKTSIVVENKTSTVVNLSDMTGKGLRTIMRDEKYTHLAILDLLMLVSHKDKVSQYVIANMNAVAEEGFFSEATPEGFTVRDKPIKRAFICCLTPDMSRDGRRMWNQIGFSSRMFPFFYVFSDDQKAKVRESISRESLRGPASTSGVVIHLENFRVPDKPIVVKLYKKFVQKIEDMAMLAAERLGDPNGFRRIKQFRALAAGHALYRTWKKPEVNQKDIDFLKKISKYISYTKGAEL